MNVKLPPFKILISILLLLLGLIPYWFFNPEIYLFSFISLKPASIIIADNLAYLLLKNYFADFVWCLALIQVFLVLKEYRVPKIYLIILLCLPFISELLQSFENIPGTFDWFDILLYSAVFIFYFHKEIYKMKKYAKHLGGSIAIAIFSFSLMSSMSMLDPEPPAPINYINGTFTLPEKKDDIFTKGKISGLLKSSKHVSVVLRVPNAGDKVTEEEIQKNAVLYNTIEREFSKAGFIVRDRALFAKVLDQENLDYSKISLITKTDFILEILSYTTSLPIIERRYKDVHGNQKQAPMDITFYGASIEFKLVSVKENDMVGSYTFYHVPCTRGCAHRFSESYRARSTKKVKKPIPHDFFVDSARLLIRELGGHK